MKLDLARRQTPDMQLCYKVPWRKIAFCCHWIWMVFKCPPIRTAHSFEGEQKPVLSHIHTHTHKQLQMATSSSMGGTRHCTHSNISIQCETKRLAVVCRSKPIVSQRRWPHLVTNKSLGKWFLYTFLFALLFSIIYVFVLCRAIAFLFLTSLCEQSARIDIYCWRNVNLSVFFLSTIVHTYLSCNREASFWLLN